MWKRSEIEQLTGLGRHAIQNLCNKNTSRDGLGFWEPAVIKPGYSRFDEGDVLMFYLVRQFIKVGFPPAEAGPVALAMLEDDDAFARSLRGRSGELGVRLAEVELQADALRRFERVVACSPETRPYAIMECELVANVERAADSVAVALGMPVSQADCLRRSFGALAQALMRKVRGEKGPAEIDSLLEEAALLVKTGTKSNHGEGAGLVMRLAACLAGPADGSDADVSQMQELLVHALVAFLEEAENGVPIELALGKGSFSYLGAAAHVCLSELIERENR